MSTTIDSKVVEMRFDNSNFERNVSTTMSSLDKFREKLKLDGATKGLESVDSAAKKVNMAGLGTAVETVQAKFSALGVMGVTALANITNQAVNTGKRMVSALTVDPIMSGFSEYETKMGAIQTIMSNTASKGTTMQDVTRVIGELNEYADKTIYNFAEMTRNIGTFTAAGVGLEEAASAIQGIANLAAASGSTSQQASTAMYQLSQALSSGTLKLMDWNSVVNAGMGGQKFQDALKATAKEHGIAVDALIKKHGSFRETLSEGWITADILNETLRKFTVEGATEYADSMMKAGKWTQEQADALIAEAQAMEDAATKVKTFTQLWDTLKESAQSGWSQTWEIVVGDFEEAKETLTEISDVIGGMIGDSANKRNDLLTGALSTGWKQLLAEGIDDAAGFQEMVSNVAKDHGVKLDEMIDDETTFQDTLKEGWLTGDILTESVTKFTDKLSGMSKEELKAAGYTQSNVDKMKKLCEQFKKGELSADEFAKKMARPSGRELLIEALWNAFRGVLTVVEPIKDAFGEIFPAMQSEQLYNMIVAFKEFSATLKLSDTATNNLKRTCKGLFSILDMALDLTMAVFKPLFGQVDNLSGGILGVTAAIGDWLVFLRYAANEADIFAKAVEWVVAIVEPIKEAFQDIFPVKQSKTMLEQLGELRSFFKSFASMLKISDKTADNIKRTFKGLFAVLDIAFMMMKSAFGLVWSIFKPLFGTVDDLSGGILGITAVLGDWLVALRDLIKENKVFSTVVEWLQKAIEGITGFGQAVSTTFSAAVDKAQTRLEPLAVLGEFVKNMFDGLGKAIKKVAPYVYAVGSAIGTFFGTLATNISSAIENADYSGLADIVNGGILSTLGLVIVKFFTSANDFIDAGASFVERIKGVLDGVRDALNSFADSLKAKALSKLAVAIGVLAASLFLLSFIPSDRLNIALFAITTLFGELMGSMAIFSKIADGKNIKTLRNIGNAMIKLAAALFILAIALKIMSSMTWEEMGVGLFSMVIALGAMVAAVNFLPEGKVNKAAKAIKKLSSAMLVLAVAIKIMSSMSMEEMAIGLFSMVIGLAALVLAVNLLPKDTASKAAGMIGLASAMVVLGTALKIMGSMSWDEMFRSLTALAGSLIVLVGAMQLMKKSLPGAFAMLIIAPALVVLASALKIMSSMSWDAVARGLVALGGSLLVIAAAMHVIKNAIAGAAALVIVSWALAVLAPVLKTLGGMSLASIGKSLLLLAGVFAVFGAAAAILKPAIPTMIKLAGALLLLGIACAAIGAGVLMLSIGLTGIAAAGSSIALALVTIISSIIGLIPYLIEQIGVGIIKFCEVIAGGASAILNAVTVIIISIVDAIVACVPALVEGVLVLVESLLVSLATHTPAIVAALFQFLIGLITAIADHLPDLIQAGVDLLMAFFTGVIDALKSIDPDVLVEGILAVGLMTAMMTAMATVAALTPAAMAGVVGFGLVMAELALVLAALGELAKIPGLEELIGGSTSMLHSIGTALGQFLGGLVGGIAAGVSSSLPQIGTDLASFMTNVQPFINGAKAIDPAMLDGVKSLVGVILALTAADILDGLTSWFTGGSSIAKFGKEIAEFAPYIKDYADTVAGIDTSAVVASATAAKALAAMTATIPNEGGVAAWFAGENSISKFGEDIVELAKGLKKYSDEIDGFNPEAVIASATAAKALAEMTSCIPNEGGVAAWFAGENSISKFGEDLKTLGEGLNSYSKSVTGIDNEAIIASVKAAQAIADMTATIPNEGGVAAWFAGENSISKFGEDLKTLGGGLKSYSESIAGFDPDAVIASANAAKAIADMTKHIPNEGGVAAWFAGENSVSRFGEDLKNLGSGLKSYSDSIVDFDPEAVTASINAAKSIADLTNHIPNEGGLVSWFTGENSISKFGTDLVALGSGLSDYSASIAGFDALAVIASANAAKAIANMTNHIPNEGGLVSWFTGESSISKFSSELITLGNGLTAYSASIAGFDALAVIASASAATAIADMTNHIPNEGGLVSWFTGESSISKFGSELIALGNGLSGYSSAIAGFDPVTVIASANAAKTIAEMASYIPNEGGLVAWLIGESSISKFGNELGALGRGLADFSTAIDGMNPENVTAAANAAKALAQMASYIPNEGGLVAWFTGDNSVVTFSGQLPTLGDGLKKFSDSVDGISPENITAAANAAKALAQMANETPENTGNLASFGNNLVLLGEDLKSYFGAMGGITADSVSAAANAVKSVKTTTDGLDPSKFNNASNAIDKFVDAVNKMSKVKGSAADGFNSAIKKLADTNVDSMIKAFKDAGSDMRTAGKTLADKFIDGISNKNSDMVEAGKTSIEKLASGIEKQESKAENACKTVASHCAEAISDKADSFKSAGKDLGSGLVNGINAKQTAVYNAAYALGQKAVQGEKDGQKSNSPSKLTTLAGKWLGEGLIIGMDQMGKKVYKAGANLGKTATGTISSTIARVADAIGSDIDTQPTIRPVLDLSDIRSGASSLNGMLSISPSVRVRTNIGAINSMMGTVGQNGTNADIVSAIDKLNKKMDNIGNTTYQINGITYDDGSNVSSAIETIARAAIKGRRT